MGLFFKAKSSYDYIIVGLGNPEKKYDNTRHNIGFMAIDKISQTFNAKVDIVKFKAMTGKCEINNKKCILLKPLTYMNLSGEAIIQAMNFYKIPIENVIVIYDDISLDVGKMRIRTKGSAGGHNGIKSIIACTGADTFPRIKLGVGQKPHPDYDLADWVLSKFTTKELPNINTALENCPKVIELIVNNQMDKAMNLFNK